MLVAQILFLAVQLVDQRGGFFAVSGELLLLALDEVLELGEVLVGRIEQLAVLPAAPPLPGEEVLEGIELLVPGGPGLPKLGDARLGELELLAEVIDLLVQAPRHGRQAAVVLDEQVIEQGAP